MKKTLIFLILLITTAFASKDMSFIILKTGYVIAPAGEYTSDVHTKAINTVTHGVNTELFGFGFRFDKFELSTSSQGRLNYTNIPVEGTIVGDLALSQDIGFSFYPITNPQPFMLYTGIKCRICLLGGPDKIPLSPIAHIGLEFPLKGSDGGYTPGAELYIGYNDSMTSSDMSIERNLFIGLSFHVLTFTVPLSK